MLIGTDYSSNALTFLPALVIALVALVSLVVALVVALVSLVTLVVTLIATLQGESYSSKTSPLSVEVITMFKTLQKNLKNCTDLWLDLLC